VAPVPGVQEPEQPKPLAAPIQSEPLEQAKQPTPL
jgi:hypothetical protein